MSSKFLLIAVLAGLCGASVPSHAQLRTVYRIGNSFTVDSGPAQMDGMSAFTPVETTSGFHIRGGANLGAIAGSRTTSIAPNGFGVWQDALVNHEWDHLIVQPFASGSSLLGDRNAFLVFADELAKNSANNDTEWLIYQSWPFRDDRTDADGQNVTWDRWFSDNNGRTQHRQDYYHSLQSELSAVGIEADIIPNADVLRYFWVNADEFASINTRADLYRDALHMNSIGQYIMGMTVLTYLNESDLTGLIPIDNYNSGLSLAERNQFLTTIWQIVNTTVNPGDLNADGTINTQDYAGWSSAFGDTDAGFDANLDGIVDAADYTVWRDNAAAASAAVPEPTGFLLLLIGTAAATARRQRG